jgi:LacI family transcriptional regulator
MNIEPVYFYHQLHWLSRNVHNLVRVEQSICQEAFIRIEYAVKKEQRHETIIQQIETAGSNHILSTRDLANVLGVSEMTIRRDLQELADAGLIQRRHGGATSPRQPARSDRHGQVGIFLVSRQEKYTDPFFNEVLQGADSKIQELGYHTAFIFTYADISENHERLREFTVDGLLLIGTHHSESVDFLKKTAPILVSASGSLGPEHDAVLFDGCTGIRQIVDHLAALGRRRIGFITGYYDPREQGFIEGIRSNNLPDDPELRITLEHGFEGWIPQLGEQGAERLMNIKNPPDAIVCASDRLAIGAIQWLHQHGFQIPDDIAVTGFDNVPNSEFSIPPLTTVNVYKRLIGELAAERIIRRIGNPDEIPLQIWTPTSLVIRQSCGNDS